MRPTALRADPFAMEARTPAINPALDDMIARGQLSPAKLTDLIRVRAIVERFAARPYLADDEVRALEERYGAKPDIVSYADYFQTEIASRYFELDDASFGRIVDTVRFDLIAAVKIFSGKPQAFRDAVLLAGEDAYRHEPETWTPEQEEAAHLFVLCNYFRDLGLAEAQLSRADEDWFDGFVNETNFAVG